MQPQKKCQVCTCEAVIQPWQWFCEVHYRRLLLRQRGELSKANRLFYRGKFSAGDLLLVVKSIAARLLELEVPPP